MLGKHDVVVPQHHWAALLVWVHNANAVIALLEHLHLPIGTPDDYSAVLFTGHLHRPPQIFSCFRICRMIRI